MMFVFDQQCLFHSISGHLADWLTENKIIEHIFGPNLHVEVSPNLYASVDQCSCHHMYYSGHF